MRTHDRSGATEIEELVGLAATVPLLRKPTLAAAVIARLCALEVSAVDCEAERQILRRIALAWTWGWQPKEIARQVRRSADGVTSGLALGAIAADHAGRARSTIDARWFEQVLELDLPDIATPNGWLAPWMAGQRVSRHAQVAAAVGLLQSLAPIHEIPILIPPPGAQDHHTKIVDLTQKSNDPMLGRVRALLAQAESTTFEAEAEAFTAKAQDLMTRHAIDMAMVSANTRRSELPDTIRIAIDDPYVGAKSLLLHVVARRSRCRAVFHEGLAMSSVVGFAADLDATEMLYTSLLVQAQTALHATSASAAAGTRARSRSFRSAFLRAYAHRVGERLDEINSAVVADAEAATGRSILPVLAARSEVVDSAVTELFGRLGTSRSRRSLDAQGWQSGRAAADRARLHDRAVSG